MTDDELRDSHSDSFQDKQKPDSLKVEVSKEDSPNPEVPEQIETKEIAVESSSEEETEGEYI